MKKVGTVAFLTLLFVCALGAVYRSVVLRREIQLAEGSGPKPATTNRNRKCQLHRSSQVGKGKR